MTSDFEEIDLRALLEICVDRTNPIYENAWREFDRRFNQWLLGKILRFTTNSSDVKDILQMVGERLCTHDFRSLKNFRAKHSETAFRTWLGTIAYTAVSAFFSKKKPNESLDNVVIVDDRQLDVDQETHESMVRMLRTVLEPTQKKDSDIERDILIYILRKHVEFKAKEVSEIRALGIKAGNVDNVVHRLNALLKKDYDNLRDL